jgi:hypothetical protein
MGKKELWFLHLNDMRKSHYESLTTVCWAGSRGELEALVERERVPSYADSDISYGRPSSYDGKWHKSFRKGGPLEWYNTPGKNSFTQVKGLPHVDDLRVSIIEIESAETALTVQ